MTPTIAVRSVPTAELTAEQLLQMRDLLWAAFPSGEEGFTEDDWQHGLGGWHFFVEEHGRIASHASVVRRELHVDGEPLETGYVESVGTHPDQRRRGLGTAVMQAASDHIRASYELGALGTGEHRFYERLGWETWQGRAYVRTRDGRERTPDEEGFIMVLRTPTTPALDLGTSISCECRPGDVW
jgi:aminoglycoside 2'-N-acetyltransferase I